MSEWNPAELITGRSKRYVRTSVALLTLTLALAASVLMFAEDRNQHIQHDFQDNDRLHLIEVTNRHRDGTVRQLRATDAANIRATIARTVPGAGFTLVERYELGGGLIGDEVTALTLYGLDESAGGAAGSKLLGLDRLQPGVGYTVKGKPLPTKVRVPVVKVQAGGYSSDELADAKLRLVAAVDPRRAAFLFGNVPNSVVVVDFATFKSLASTMFGGSWKSIVARYDRGELNLTPLIGGEYVQVKELDDVEHVATAIEASGYDSTYALRAFDELSDSLRSQALLGLGLVLVTILGATVFLGLSWNAYFTLSRRDMGMLKHFGYGESRIRRIYGHRVTTGCRNALLVVSAYVIAGSLVLLGAEGLLWAAVNVALLAAVVLLVRLLLVRVVLSRHVRTDVLTLLRLDRQFQ